MIGKNNPEPQPADVKKVIDLGIIVEGRTVRFYEMRKGGIANKQTKDELYY